MEKSKTSRNSSLIGLICLLLVCAVGAAPAFGRDDVRGGVPPRLSLISGEVSFWRPGAEDWAAARLNMPLAPGDALYAGSGANLELQVGSRAFVRAAGDTELALLNQEPGYLQFKLAAGVAALDLRTLAPRSTVELDTPNAVLAIAHPGYYRVELNDGLRVISRRGGQAIITLADGERFSILPGREIVVRGAQGARIESYAAPPPDNWDRWNDARSDRLIRSASARHLSPAIYGAEDLDRYGSWRAVPDYGSVWAPAGVAPGWAPYSAGSWVWDPFYGWTWVDDSPWGWAPFHYGRWVFIDGFWAWAPGPVVASIVYAPALVAFFDIGRSPSFSIGIGTPGLAWVALAWGEPLIPWWGGSGFIGRPWWGGWGGPRVVNNVVVRDTQAVNLTNIRFRNTRVQNAVLTAPGDEFGRRRLHATPVTAAQLRVSAPVQGQVPIKPDRASLVGGAPKSTRPPQSALSRPVLATRPVRAGPLAMPKVDSAPSTEVRLVPRTGRKGELIKQPPAAAAQAFPERRPAPPAPRMREESRLPMFPPPPSHRAPEHPLKPEPPSAAQAPHPRTLREAPLRSAPEGRELQPRREDRVLRREGPAPERKEALPPGAPAVQEAPRRHVPVLHDAPPLPREREALHQGEAAPRVIEGRPPEAGPDGKPEAGRKARKPHDEEPREPARPERQ